MESPPSLLDAGSRYVRRPRAVAVSAAREVLFAGPGAESVVVDDVDVELVTRTWHVLATSRSGAELRALLPAPRDVAEALVSRLTDRGFVLNGALTEHDTSDRRTSPADESVVCDRLVLGVSGAVQAAFAPRYVQWLLNGFANEIDVVLTDAATRFVQPFALRALGAAVWQDPFEPDRAAVPHIHLARRADLVVVLPASAHTLFRLAHGASSDLLSLVASATQAPVVVAPSMNPHMWNSPAVRRNVALLRDDGVLVVEPGVGLEVADRAADPTVGPAGLPPDASLIPVLRTVLSAASRTRHDAEAR